MMQRILIQKSVVSFAIIISIAIFTPTTATASTNALEKQSDPVVTDHDLRVLPRDTPSTTPEVSVVANEVRVATNDAGFSWRLPGESVSLTVNTSRIPEERISTSKTPLASTFDRGAVLSTYPTEIGAQTLIEIPSNSAPREYTFPLNMPTNAKVSINADGSVSLIDPKGPIGHFKKPWAVDAKGRNIATNFRLENGALIQEIHFDESSNFPVVADPDFGGEWWGWYLQATSDETRQLANSSGNIQSLAGVISSLCGLIPFPPAAVACTAGANAVALSYAWRIRDAAASGRCVAFNLPWTVITHPYLVHPNMTVVDCRR